MCMPVKWEERYEVEDRERLMRLTRKGLREAYENGIITREEFEAAISDVESADDETIGLVMEAMVKMGLLRKVKCPVVYDGRGNAVVFGTKNVLVYGFKDPRRLVEEEVEDEKLKEQLLRSLDSKVVMYEGD